MNKKIALLFHNTKKPCFYQKKISGGVASTETIRPKIELTLFFWQKSFPQARVNKLNNPAKIYGKIHSPRTELVKTPKVYFLDNGFRNYLLSDFKEIKKRDDVGKLVENFVYSSLKRKKISKLNFWRTKSKAEIDFILQKQGEIIPAEVKYSKIALVGKSFYSFIEKFSPKKGYILTKNLSKTKKIKKAQIYFPPVYYL